MQNPVRITVVLIIISLLGAFVSGYWLLSRPLPEIQAPFVGLPTVDITDERSYSNRSILERLGEISIRTVAPDSNEFYRLTLMPAFDEPIVILVSKSGNAARLTTKVFDGHGGFGLDEVGKLAVNETRELSAGEFQDLQNVLDSAFFWELPNHDPNDVAVRDGASWVLEARRDSLIHWVNRITPNEKELEVFRYMLRLANRESHYNGYWN